jgi:hypothetical protein
MKVNSGILLCRKIKKVMSNWHVDNLTGFVLGGVMAKI